MPPPRTVDPALVEILEQKARDALRGGEARRLAGALAGGSGQFERGVDAGRLYNAFHYQSRRILGRDPTDEEFAEFVEFARRRLSG